MAIVTKIIDEGGKWTVKVSDGRRFVCKTQDEAEAKETEILSELPKSDLISMLKNKKKEK